MLCNNAELTGQSKALTLVWNTLGRSMGRVSKDQQRMLWSSHHLPSQQPPMQGSPGAPSRSASLRRLSGVKKARGQAAESPARRVRGWSHCGGGGAASLPGSHSPEARCTLRHTGCGSSHWAPFPCTDQSTAEHRWLLLLEDTRKNEKHQLYLLQWDQEIWRKSLEQVLC